MKLLYQMDLAPTEDLPATFEAHWQGREDPAPDEVRDYAEHLVRGVHASLEEVDELAELLPGDTNIIGAEKNLGFACSSTESPVYGLLKFLCCVVCSFCVETCYHRGVFHMVVSSIS